MPRAKTMRPTSPHATMAIPWDELRTAVLQVVEGQKTHVTGYGWAVWEDGLVGSIRIQLGREALGLPRA